jgi:cell division protein FtsL
MAGASRPARPARRGALSAQRVLLRRNPRDMAFFYSVLKAFSVILAVASVFLWSRLMVVNIGYDISNANTAREELIERNKRLNLTFMTLKSPERIERIAQSELGLVYPTGAEVVRIK